MRPDIRQLQYFLAVADELNFTRAAERLDVVQQSLSTAIAQLEALLGIKLFERTTRSVTLTAEGAAWLPYAREALAAADRAAEAAQDLAAGRAGRLRVGLAATAGLDVTPRLLRAFAERFPRVELAIQHFDFGDPAGGLRERLQQGPRDVRVIEHEGLEAPGGDGQAAQLAVGGHRRGARAAVAPPTVGAICRTCNDLFEAARARRATGLVPESVAHAESWPSLAFVEVRDIAPSTLAIAWRSDNGQLAVRSFVELATELATASPSGPPTVQAAT